MSDIRTNAEQFADTGNPWATRDDWIREEKLAGNQLASTAARKSARSYTRRASMFPGKAQPRPEHSDPAPLATPLTYAEDVTRRALGIRNRLARAPLDPVELSEAADRFVRSATNADFAGIGAHPEALAASRAREEESDWDKIKPKAKRDADWQAFLARERAELAERRDRAAQNKNKA